MKKLGLFIGRMNPPHKGHIAVIEKALQENEQVLVLLGCNGIVDTSNPLTFKQREKLLKKYFGENKKLEIDIIKDTKTDLEWVQNISKIIKNKYGEMSITIYGGDFQKDSAIIAMKQFEYILGKNISYISINRFLETIKHNGKQYNISATNLRNALRNGDKEFVEKFCNKELIEDIINYFK